MKRLTKLLLITCTMLFVGCNQQPAEQAETWQVDEVLSHLSELRQEVAALRSEVKQLSARTDKLKSKPIKKPAVFMPLGQQKPLGDEKATIAIVEFSDYQCPFCVRHTKQVYPKLIENYIKTGQVKYYMRHFPLGFHAKARDAAIVVECAAKQDKQWPVHEFLFAHSRQLGEETFQQVIREFGLNQTDFNRCRKDKAIAAKIDADMALGKKMGVTGTPKFFIGRIKNNQLVGVVPLSGAQPYQAFEQVIQSFDKKE